MLSVEQAVTNYILAKDGNRPLLMQRAFAANSQLDMIVNTDAISFPSSAEGLSNIADILVSRFNIDHENIFTFCLSRPTEAHADHFSCHWLVGMSVKAGGTVRVGAGRYDWHFGDSHLVDRLTITIDTMAMLPPGEAGPVFEWLMGLPYPWCPKAEALGRMPSIGALASVRSFLGRPNP